MHDSPTPADARPKNASGDPHRTDAQDDGPASADRPPPGLVDGTRYAVVRRLGTGGMGATYLVRNLLMNRLEVAKVVRPHLAGRGGADARFAREVEAVGRLRHPNVAAGYGADRFDGRLVLFLEYIDGVDLDKRLADAPGGLPVATACEYARQAALGLAHAHAHGLVHRDVKPSNLMAHPDGAGERVVVLDFGLAKAAAAPADAKLTRDGSAVGTPLYMPPEQWADAAAADARSDVYALGATLFHLIAGRPPFDHSTAGLLLAHVRERPARLDAVRPGVPRGLADLVERMLAKDPAARPQTMAEVAAALAPFTAGEQRSERPGLSRLARRWAWPVAAAAVLVAVVAVVAVAVALRPRPPGEPDQPGQPRPLAESPAAAPVVAPPPEPPAPKVARSVDRDWAVAGDEVIQTNTQVKFASLAIGEHAWTDYDFTFDARRIGRDGQFGAYARLTTPRVSAYLFTAGLGGSTAQFERCYFRNHPLGLRYDVLETADRPIAGDTWYAVRVRVRGTKFEFAVDGVPVIAAENDEFPTGKAGLRTYHSAYRFRNLKVTAPDGTVLWDGLPDRIEPAAD
jgi:hypothetical protein